MTMRVPVLNHISPCEILLLSQSKLPEPVPASFSIELVLELMIGPIQSICPYDE